MERISAVINVVDREIPDLRRALSSLKKIASEIVIVDMTSSDEVNKIASGYQVKVYKHDLVNYVEIVRNFGISKTQNEWILIMDPDEEISVDLAEKLKDVVSKKEADYFRLPRKNIIFGKWIKHSRWWPDYNIRFFKKGYVSWNEIIHSVPMTQGKGIDLDPSEENSIIHYHYKSVEQYIERMNRYTSVQAGNLLKNGYCFDWRDLIKKPFNEFMSRYFDGNGFKDGLHGLVLAGLQAFSELTVYLKVWQSDKFKDYNTDPKKTLGVMDEIVSDYHHWRADTLLKSGGSFVQKIKRKFKLP